METIEYFYLLAFGIILIGLEALIFSFFLIWLGLGFIIVSILTYFNLFDSGNIQIAFAFGSGLLLLLILRKPIMSYIQTSANSEEEKIHQSGIGIVDNGMIKMDGTYWNCDEDLSQFKEGERVEVVDIIKNKAIINIK